MNTFCKLKRGQQIYRHGQRYQVRRVFQDWRDGDWRNRYLLYAITRYGHIKMQGEYSPEQLHILGFQNDPPEQENVA